MPTGGQTVNKRPPSCSRVVGTRAALSTPCLLLAFLLLLSFFFIIFTSLLHRPRVCVGQRLGEGRVLVVAGQTARMRWALLLALVLVLVPVPVFRPVHAIER